MFAKFYCLFVQRCIYDICHWWLDASTTTGQFSDVRTPPCEFNLKVEQQSPIRFYFWNFIVTLPAKTFKVNEGACMRRVNWRGCEHQSDYSRNTETQYSRSSPQLQICLHNNRIQTDCMGSKSYFFSERSYGEFWLLSFDLSWTSASFAMNYRAFTSDRLCSVLSLAQIVVSHKKIKVNNSAKLTDSF